MLGKAEFRYRASSTAAASRMRNRKRSGLSTQSTSDFLDTTAAATANSLSHSTDAPRVSTSEYMSGRGEDLTFRQFGSSDLFYSFKKNLKRAVLNEQLHVSLHVRNNMDINSDGYARKNTKKRYTSLAYLGGIMLGENQARRCLLISDFEPYFKTAQDAN